MLAGLAMKNACVNYSFFFHEVGDSILKSLMLKTVNIENTDILFLRWCLGDASAAVKGYLNKFLGRNLANVKTFRSVQQRCRESCNGKSNKFNSGQPKIDRKVLKDSYYSNFVDEDSTNNVRNIAMQTNTYISYTWRTLKEQLLHSYYYRQVQRPLPDDLPVFSEKYIFYGPDYIYAIRNFQFSQGAQ